MAPRIIQHAIMVTFMVKGGLWFTCTSPNGVFQLLLDGYVLFVLQILSKLPCMLSFEDKKTAGHPEWNVLSTWTY